MSAICFLIAVVNANAWFLPAPTDKVGWALRVRTSENPRLFLAEESIEHREVEIVLINRSKTTREYTTLKLAAEVGDLNVSIIQPNGKQLVGLHTIPQREPAKDDSQLVAGRFESSAFLFIRAGLTQLSGPGVYELHASLKTAEGVVVAPAVKFKVIEPAHTDILMSVPAPLEGQEARYPKENQERALIQQIKVEDRFWLFYRRFMRSEIGGGTYASYRIAELPGKVVDLKVEGAFGDWNPLTITYRETTYTKWTTKHVINSIDGRPWTEAEEKHRQEKLKLDAKLPAEKK